MLKYQSLRNLVSKQKDKPNFKALMLASIYRWAKDEGMELSEFGFLLKKALEYLKLYDKQDNDKRT